MGPRRAATPDESPGLEVVGVASFIHENDDTAAFVNSDAALVVWKGESELDTEIQMDRFDVRHLLTDLKGLGKRKRRSNSADPSGEVEELQKERYRDLKLEVPQNTAAEREEKAGQCVELPKVPVL